MIDAQCLPVPRSGAGTAKIGTAESLGMIYRMKGGIS